MSKKHKKKKQRRRQIRRELRRVDPRTGRTTLAMTRRRLNAQAARHDRLHRRRLALLTAVGGSLALYTLGAALAVTASHLPTAIVALVAALPLLALALRATTLAWPERALPRIGPTTEDVIALTPPPHGGAVSQTTSGGAASQTTRDSGTSRKATRRAARARLASEATPTPLTEPELRLSLARWNTISIEANEVHIQRLTAETERAARWTLTTALAVATALLTLGLIRVVALALQDNEPARTYFVG